MNSKNLSPVEEWLAWYGENPFEALDDLLSGRFHMGNLEMNETHEILFRLFHKKGKKALHRLDSIMKEWFENQWGKASAFISASQWAGILKNALIAVYRLGLEETALFLKDSYLKDKSWIRSVYVAPSRDPEAEMLRVLAFFQKDHSLLPLWMRLCRWEEDVPLSYTSIGILGLRRLPDKNGEPPGDLPKAFFKGMITLAEVLLERSRPGYKDFWLREMRAIAGLYPRSKRYWADRFGPMLYYSSDSPAAEWLNKAIPKVTDQFGRKVTLFLQPPPKEEFEKILKLVQNKSLKDIQNELDAFLDRHRAYAYQTGDSFFLVRTFSNIGYKVFKQDADYALALVEEAAEWEPYNAFLWSERAVIEAFRGNPSRAEAILWEARRRFPEDPAIRNDLAKLLGKRKKYRTAEALYRQTMEDFPGDVVCRAGLAEVLKDQGKFGEAESVYRQTMEDFPGNVVCRAGLAEVLKDQGKPGEAESVYRQTMEDFPGDDVCRNGLAEVLKDQGKFGEAESVYRQTMEDFPSDVVCRTGLAVVLVKLNKRDEAISLLEETLEKFPGNKVAREFSEKIKSKEIIPKEYEKKLQRETAQPVKEESTPIKPDEEIPEMSEFSLETPPIGIVAEPAVQYNKEVEVEIGDIEGEIGEVALERWLSGRMEEAEKEEYQIETAAALGHILEKAPDNIPALLLKGLWLADQDPGEAEKYLSLHARLRPNTIGFQLMELRVKGQQNNILNEDQWNQLTRDFPGRATLIKLEHALYALEYTNGSGKPLKQLEQLRQQISKGHRHLPPSLQKNEEWVLNNIQQGLFKDIDTTQQVTAKTFETLESNFQRMKHIYKNTVEQCVSAAI